MSSGFGNVWVTLDTLTHGCTPPGKPENSAGSDEDGTCKFFQMGPCTLNPNPSAPALQDEDFEDSGTVASSPKPSEAADLLQLEDGDLPGDKDRSNCRSGLDGCSSSPCLNLCMVWCGRMAREC